MLQQFHDTVTAMKHNLLSEKMSLKFKYWDDLHRTVKRMIKQFKFISFHYKTNEVIVLKLCELRVSFFEQVWPPEAPWSLDPGMK